MILSNSDDNNIHRFELERVAFYGRTMSEYLIMFGLDDVTSLKKYNAILDCPSGASSFVAEAAKYGINAVGCDPLFDKHLRILHEQGDKDIEYVVQRVSQKPDLYNWEFYSSVDKLKELRKLALRHFISDYADGVREKRYIKGMLPRLPFGDKAFDLVLSGHFIFTYSYRFDFSFILSSLVELVRVSCREVRIYPIQKSSLQPYEHMTKLLDILKRKHRIDHKIVTVSFEFQKGSNKMLRLSHKK